MYEKPLERLNYFNGQRLEAADLKTEQDYHIRTRRWLNKSLYSAGIGRGLEVRAVPRDPATQDPPRVGVSLGLAIDDDGREIILLEEALIEVCSYSGTGESTVVGNYLVIEYAEETQAFERNGGCAVRETGARTSTSTTNFGGPSRVQAKPKFSWIPFPPQPGSNQVALARVELGSDCTTVHQIDAGIRRYIGAASAAKVRQYALEGERHIDKDNSGRIYFHIRGRQPNSVTLYLRAEKFSTLYYTELGQHHHSNSATGFTITVPAHSHTITPIVTPDVGSGTGAAGDHTPIVSSVSADADTDIWHGVLAISGTTAGVANPVVIPAIAVALGVAELALFAADAFDPGNGMNLTLSPRPFRKFPGADIKTRVNMNIVLDKLPTHVHAIPIFTETEPAQLISLSGSGSSSNAGVSNVAARNDVPNDPAKREYAHTFIDDLQVLIGESVPQLQNKTSAILGQLRDVQQNVTWDKLGNGTAGHVFAVEGTRAIRLDFLPGVTFSEGKEYVIDLRVASGGGRILYNLYIE